MAEYDEQLAEGLRAEAPPSTQALTPELLPHWDRMRGCLDLLRKRYPCKLQPGAELTGHAVPVAPAFGRFRLRRELGRGGFGVVFLADDPSLDRPVALKVPRPEVLFDVALRDRFLREARTAASLDHPNIISIHEAGQVGPVCYLVSAYCPGPTLAVWLRHQAQPVPPRLAAAVVVALADAVAHAHAGGIFHRDLKPANVLLAPLPTGGADNDLGLPFAPKLTDFELAKWMELDTQQTTSGLLVGTPAYMAPEQADGQSTAGAGTDVYALGVILYELLTGQPPFVGNTLPATLEMIRECQPPALR
jgi:serine/threonine protein kinase